MTRTYISIMPEQGLISQFKFDKYANQIYRSVMPNGCYDDENSIIDQWRSLNIDYYFILFYIILYYIILYYIFILFI